MQCVEMSVVSYFKWKLIITIVSCEALQSSFACQFSQL